MIQTVGGGTDFEEQLRLEGARLLKVHLSMAGWTRQQFRKELADRGCEVSLTTIANWQQGRFTPKASHQRVIASCFRVPRSAIFPDSVAA